MSLTYKPGKQSAEDFITEANKTPQGSHKNYPWNEPGVRADVKKDFVLRLPEPLYLKLKYISENTSDSMQSFCQKHLIEQIEQELSRLR